MKQPSSKKLTGFLIIIIPTALIVGPIVWSVTRPRPGDAVANQGNRHLTSLTDSHELYNSKPPTSGPHGVKASWGVTDTQIPDEMQVHNLEDGGVIVHYDPVQVTSSTIQALEEIVNPYYIKGKSIILEPYSGMDFPIILTAWTRMLKLQTIDAEVIKQFIDAYIGVDHHVPGQ